jgi:hypothetical protein
MPYRARSQTCPRGTVSFGIGNENCTVLLFETVDFVYVARI